MEEGERMSQSTNMQNPQTQTQTRVGMAREQQEQGLSAGGQKGGKWKHLQ